MKPKILLLLLSAFAAPLLLADLPPAQATENPAAPTGQAAPADPPPVALAPAKPLGKTVLNGLGWLAKAQNGDGGWGQGGGWRTHLDKEGAGRGRVEGDQVSDPSDIGNTSMVLQVFLRAGVRLDRGENSEIAAKAAAFLLAALEADDDESLYVTKLRDTQLQSKIGRYVDTFLAAQILADLKDRLPNPADEARRAKQLDRLVAKIQKHQGDDGAFEGNGGWAATLSQGFCSRSLNAARSAGAKVDLATLEKDHLQNAAGLDRQSGVVAGGAGAVADAGVEIYRYSSKLGGMTEYSKQNAGRRDELAALASAPGSSPETQQQAKEEISKIDQADGDQKVLLKQVAARVGEKAFVGGYGNNGGEEFISYMNIGEALRANGGEEWTKWDDSMTKMLEGGQNADGSWTGQHCITGRTFCTATALMVLMTDRANLPVIAKNAQEPAK